MKKNEIHCEEDHVRRGEVIQIILHQWAHFSSADEAIQVSVDKIRDLPRVNPKAKTIVNNGTMNLQL